MPPSFASSKTSPAPPLAVAAYSGATALNNAPIFGEMSAVGMGLYTVGISRDSILKCEAVLAEGKQLLLVHGSTHQVEEARLMMGRLGGLVLQ